MTSPSPSTNQSPSPGTFQAGVVFGFPIRVHWTWLMAFALITWTFSTSFLPRAYPDWPAERWWAVALTSTVLFFGSVLLHELAHALMARRFGHPVRDITLFLLGGASSMETEPRRAKEEFWIALVGPLTSLGLAVLFTAIWAGAQLTGVEVIAPLAGYLGWLNFTLGVFNLLPGFPLDGGRVLRAAVWGRTQDLLKATRVAGVSGRIVAAGLAGFGLWTVISGSAVGGIWLMLVAWFLFGAATASEQQTLLSQTLSGVPVEQLVDPDVPRVSPALSLREFADEWVIARGRRAAFVAATEDADALGLVTLSDLSKVPDSEWATTTVFRVMTPVHQLVVASPTTEALAALQLMATHNLQQLPVVRGKETVGLLTRTRLLAAIQLRSQLRRTA